MKQALAQEKKLNRLVTQYNMLKVLPLVDENEVSSDSDLEEVVLPKLDKTSQQREEIGFLSDSLVSLFFLLDYAVLSSYIHNVTFC